MVLKDGSGRPLLNLRIAITNQCNLNCEYCHKEGEERQDVCFSEEMTVSEIIRIANVAVSLGVSRIKLTGGEPLMRKDIAEIVKGIASIDGLKDLSMTTNGTMLASLAQELREAGLNRVNVTLPTLDDEVYNRLTGGRVAPVLEGIRAAVRASLNPVKLNMLLLNDVNDRSVPDMMRFAAENGVVLQLIELEPINIDREYYRARHKSMKEYEGMLRDKSLSVKRREYMQNRQVYCLPDVQVELIQPIENTEFCEHCTRMRVTSDGKLKPCLMVNDNLVDVMPALRKEARRGELTDLFLSANLRRKPYNLE